MDYNTLIDAEIWAFIKDTQAHYPDDTAMTSAASQRDVYDKMCRAFFAGYPEGVSARDTRAGNVPIRIYECGLHNATLVYFHGGGFVVGGLDSHDDVCAEICARANIRVVSVDYRLSPENIHPAAFEDAQAAVQYVSLTWPGTLILAGDSAGGNLAACVAHAVRGAIELAGQLLIYPALGGDISLGSYVDHAHAPMLSMADLKAYEQLRFGGEPAKVDPTSAPLSDTDFSGLPPTVIITAECDPLADDGRDYRDAILSAGGKAHWVNEEGLVHGYLRARHCSARASASFDRIIDTICMFSADEWRN